MKNNENTLRKFPLAKYDALEVSRYVINLFNEKGYKINNLKLQCVLYLLQGNALRNLGYPLFREDIVRWKYEPAIPVVFHEYLPYGTLDIPTIREYKCFAPNKYRPVIRKYVPPHFNHAEIELINDLIDKLNNISSERLCPIVKNHEIIKNTEINEIIQLSAMYEYFKK